MGTSWLFVGEDMGEERVLAFAGGQAVVFSAKAPDKPGPNEDAAALVELGPGIGLLAVADGLGGQPAGESAAERAVRTLAQELSRTPPDAAGLRRAVLDAVERTNRALLQEGLGAATTLAAAEIVLDRLRPYHVGDSSILLVGQRGKLKLQTVAHSPVGYAVESGLLAEDEAMHHEDRHLVSNALGSNDMRIELGSPLRLAARDTLLLATDGLLDNLHLEEIVNEIRSGPLVRAARGLAERARARMREPQPGEPSKPDDLTFILFRRAQARRRNARSSG